MRLACLNGSISQEKMCSTWSFPPVKSSSACEMSPRASKGLSVPLHMVPTLNLRPLRCSTTASSSPETLPTRSLKMSRRETIGGRDSSSFVREVVGLSSPFAGAADFLGLERALGLYSGGFFSLGCLMASTGSPHLLILRREQVLVVA